ncbi:protein-L-isoaspartate O-methyltransferase [Paucibacter sp. APW11]|uniref:Protein-L-isoaspartate O-methyltransferase n=1 Tax=Roseateles aquae TaxID=3077235 RepID=A0ABU3P9V9_9BURK|nr:protein-L-isoaspartate O-methyltransferase [Paucibacter sp. APW11]MDT8999000.1 protein-L-isoaspartate O-methyltransferase [Paucibacter sp. APW11]
MNFEQARFNMIEQQIRPWDVLDPAVLSLLSVVKREDFVPAAYRNMAFTDTELPLGAGHLALAPRVEARLLQSLAVERHEKVLEIGTGTGFLAAMLGHRAQRVITLESNAAIAKQAGDNLRRAGLANVTVREGDGRLGLAGEAPFDAILLSGSVQEVPDALLQQLKVGGRLLAIVGDEPVMRATLVRRVSEQEFKSEALFDTLAPRLPGFADSNAFSF